MCFNPSLREINLQLCGKMEETRTMLHAAIPALRKASSKLESRSRCLPTPFVRKIFFATNAMGGAGVRCPLISADSKRSAHPSCAKNSRENFYACEKVTRTHHRVNQFPTLMLNPCNEFDQKAIESIREGYSTGQSFRNFSCV